MTGLEKKFGFVIELSRAWRLSENGLDERLYRATSTQNYPLTPREIKELKKNFAKENLILEVYRLEKL